MALVLVVVARFDGVFDRVAVAQAVGQPGMDSAAGRHDNDVDTRLVLQLGMLLALLYVAFVCVWLSRTRGGAALGDVLDRLRSRASVALATLQ
jgi:hypothetical protein